MPRGWVLLVVIPNAQFAPLDPGTHRSWVQRPATHVVPVGHTSVEFGPQNEVPPSLVTHRPAAHTPLVVHETPHAPQCVELARASMQVLPQQIPFTPAPRGQLTPSLDSEHVGIGVQLPLEQNWLAAHARPQEPQCCELVRMLAHAPRQHLPLVDEQY